MTKPKVVAGAAKKPARAKKAVAAPVVPPSPLFRDLPSFFVIDAKVFANETPLKQTELIASAAGKNIRFVPSFSTLRDRTSLRDRLLKGTDVTLEVEFNGIDLTDADRATLAAVQPILDRLMDAMKTSYPWIEGGKPTAMTMRPLNISRNGYDISVDVAKRLWAKASRAWGDGVCRMPSSVRERADGSYRDISFRRDEIVIGCQHVPRVDVEAIARHYGWEPNVKA